MNALSGCKHKAEDLKNNDAILGVRGFDLRNVSSDRQSCDFAYINKLTGNIPFMTICRFIRCNMRKRLGRER